MTPFTRLLAPERLILEGSIPGAAFAPPSGSHLIESSSEPSLAQGSHREVQSLKTRLVASKQQESDLLVRASMIADHKVILPQGFQPGPVDIWCGRGKTKWSGNQRLRAIVKERVADYAKLTSKGEKGSLLQEIVMHVRGLDSPSAKAPIGPSPEFVALFVKQDPESGQWFDIGNSEAKERVSQIFRDHLSERYSSSNVAKNAKKKNQRQRLKASAGEDDDGKRSDKVPVSRAKKPRKVRSKKSPSPLAASEREQGTLALASLKEQKFVLEAPAAAVGAPDHQLGQGHQVHRLAPAPRHAYSALQGLAGTRTASSFRASRALSAGSDLVPGPHHSLLEQEMLHRRMQLLGSSDLTTSAGSLCNSPSSLLAAAAEAMAMSTHSLGLPRTQASSLGRSSLLDGLTAGPTLASHAASSSAEDILLLANLEQRALLLAAEQARQQEEHSNILLARIAILRELQQQKQHMASA